MFIILKKIKETIKRMEPKHHHINLLLIITILLIVIFMIMIKPALIGYKISEQFEEIGVSTSAFLKDLDSVKSKLLVTETNLESCKSLKDDLVVDVSKEKDISLRCMQEKSSMESGYESLVNEYKFNISRIKPDFDNQKKELEKKVEQEKLKAEDARADYDALLENVANNICCKAKVDNKDIDSYFVSNNMIVCTSGEENKISC